MKNLFKILGTGALLLACSSPNNEQEVAKIEQGPEPRIISASKQYTEFIYALGAADNLVGVDLSSTYPKAAQSLPNIGYHMHLGLEGIMSLKPSLLLHKGGHFSIGPKQVVDQLENLNLPMYSFENKAKDITSTKKLLREMGIYFGKQVEADSLCQKLDQDLLMVKDKLGVQSDTVKVVVIHFGQAMNIYLAVGAESVAGKMVEMAGGKICIDKKGMERITSPELIAQANPDVILLTDFGYDRLGSKEKVMELPGIAETNAAKNGNIHRVEGYDLIYFGPRTGENVLKLHEIIHDND